MKIEFRFLLRLYLFSVLLILLVSTAAFSQDTNCAEKLKTAQSLFENGQVDQVPGMLNNCIKSGFTREEAILAYKLLIQCYLLDDKLDEADSMMLVFLKKNPEYRISATDHSSFVNLYNNYDEKPLVQVAAHVGTNLPFLFISNNVSASAEGGESVYSTNAFNLFLSVEAKFELSEKIELNAEMGYSQIKFSSFEDFMGFGNINYEETQKRIEIPVSSTYNFSGFGKFTPYGRFGLGVAFILGSDAQADLEATDINNPFDHTGPDLDRQDSRITMDVFAQIGAGLKYKIRGGYLLTEIRSNFGLMNQTVRGGASSEELGTYYYYIDDDFSINTLNFSLGYVHIIYKPSKRKA